MFKPSVVLKTLEAIQAELTDEPGYDEVFNLVEAAVEACKEAMDPLAGIELTHEAKATFDYVAKTKVIPFDKGPMESYPEQDDEP